MENIEIVQTSGEPGWPPPSFLRVLDGFYIDYREYVWYNIQANPNGSVFWESGVVGEPLAASGYVSGIKLGFTIQGWGQMEAVLEFVTPEDLEEKLNSLGNVRLRGVTKAWMPA
jgi:hypothetical protein